MNESHFSVFDCVGATFKNLCVLKYIWEKKKIKKRLPVPLKAASAGFSSRSEDTPQTDAAHADVVIIPQVVTSPTTACKSLGYSAELSAGNRCMDRHAGF